MKVRKSSPRARVSVTGDEVTTQMWTPAMLPVVPRGDEDADEVKSGEGSSDAWSLRSIASSSSRRVRTERTVDSVIDGVTDCAAS
jgi:hypothetical protein